MTKLFAFGDSYPAGDEIDIPKTLGITTEEWIEYVGKNWDEKTSQFRIMQKYTKEKNLGGVRPPAVSFDSYPYIIGKILNLETKNYARNGTGYYIACDWAIQKMILGEIQENDIIFMGVTDLKRMSYYAEPLRALIHVIPGSTSNIDYHSNLTTTNNYTIEYIRNYLNDYNVFNNALMTTCNLLNTAKRYGVKILLYDILQGGLNSIKDYHFNLTSYLQENPVSNGQRTEAYSIILEEIKEHQLFEGSLSSFSEWGHKKFVAPYELRGILLKEPNKQKALYELYQLGFMPGLHFTKEKHQFVGEIFAKTIKEKWDQIK